jgi:hypothetical protein
MHSCRRILPGVIICVALAVGAYFAANGMMDALNAYRSPLNSDPIQPAQPLGSPITRRLVFVLVDALRADTASRADLMPVLDRLRSQGASTSMHSQPPSLSQPGWSTLLTGAWPELNGGPAWNVDADTIPTLAQDNLFSSAKRAGLKTALSGYDWFEKLVPQDAVSVYFYTPGEDRAADRAVVDAALKWLTEPAYQLVLIHLDQVDYAGEQQGGPRGPAWAAAAQRADALIGEISAKLDFQKDTLLIASDHGQIDAGGHGGTETVTLTEPFVLVGAGVKPGKYGDIQMVDVAPTLAVLLGLNLPAASQGQSRVEMLNLAENTLPALQQATQLQQEQFLKAYLQAIHQPEVAPPAAPDTITEFQATLQQTRLARLTRERLPRMLAAVLIGLAALVFIFWKRSRGTVWLFVGGGLYLLLFNLRYAVLDGRTYSFSSVGESSTGLILYCGLTAVLAFLIAWLFSAARLKLLGLGRAQAAGRTLDLALVTIYLLAVPILLHFAINGLFITWALPDFQIFFLALLALIQVLFVALSGLLLAGLSAFLAIGDRKKKYSLLAQSE